MAALVFAAVSKALAAPPHTVVTRGAAATVAEEMVGVLAEELATEVGHQVVHPVLLAVAC